MYLIDTNVMLAASAVFDTLSNLALRAMPREIELREMVYQWLTEFDKSADQIVMDEEGLIRAEYDRQMPFNTAFHDQEYGLQVLQNKYDRCLDIRVPIDVLTANGEKIAQLSTDLEAIVTDREDRKWVAASIATNDGHGIFPPIVYAADSDWYEIEKQLLAHGIQLQRLLPDGWYTNEQT
jgi:hypothetical protein